MELEEWHDLDIWTCVVGWVKQRSLKQEEGKDRITQGEDCRKRHCDKTADEEDLKEQGSVTRLPRNNSCVLGVIDFIWNVVP